MNLSIKNFLGSSISNRNAISTPKLMKTDRSSSSNSSNSNGPDESRSRNSDDENQRRNRDSSYNQRGSENMSSARKKNF